MRHSMEIHPDSIAYNGFSQYLSYYYYEWVDGRESPIIFKENQKITCALFHMIKISDEPNKNFLHTYVGACDMNFSFTYKDQEFNVEVITKEYLVLREGHEKLYTYFVVNFDDMTNFESLGIDIKVWQTKFLDNMMRRETKIIIFANDETMFRRVARKPKRSLDTILLPEKDKQSLIDKIDHFMKPETKSLYERLGKNYKMIILFHGLPGTGKTSFIHAIASHFEKDIAMYAHEKKNDDAKFRQLLKNVHNKILCLEDMDCLFNTRETEDKSGITFSGIINTLDGFLSPQDEDGNPFICFITTNCIDKLDKTLIRPGRVDHFLEFTEIRKTERRKMFINYFGEERADEFEEAFKSIKTKVTPATLDMYLFGYLDNPSGAIENIADIIKMKELTTSRPSQGMYS